MKKYYSMLAVLFLIFSFEISAFAQAVETDTITVDDSWGLFEESKTEKIPLPVLKKFTGSWIWSMVIWMLCTKA